MHGATSFSARPFFAVLLGVAGFAGMALAGPDEPARLTLTPVAAKVGAYPLGTTINGQQITLPGSPARLWFEVRVENWDPQQDADPLLRILQYKIDASGYLGVNANPPAGVDLRPADAACSNNADCVSAFGESGSQCAANRCQAGYQNISRADWLALGRSAQAAVDVDALNYRYAVVLDASEALIDDGDNYYAGTLVLDVPAGAAGTYTVFGDLADSFLLDEQPAPDPIAADILGFTVVVGGESLEACCLPDDSCVSATTQGCQSMGGASRGPGSTCQSATCETSCCAPEGTCSVVLQSACGQTGGFSVSSCLGDGNQNGRDDACDWTIPAGEDCWNTVCGRTRVGLCDNPIPADFFGPGSEPFTGVIRLGGAELEGPDTRVARLLDMFLPEPPVEIQIPIELVHLNLVSCEPITVMANSQPSEWNVAVGLSTSPQPAGTLSVSKTMENGGVFTASLPVRARFVFSRVDNPGEIRVFDTGAEGVGPVLLESVHSAPWVHRLSPGSTTDVCGTNFVPGVEENPETGEQCCRPVGHAGPGHLHETALPDCTACPTGACLEFGSGACTPTAGAQNCAGQYQGDGTDCADSDSDGLADVRERGDCCGSPDGSLHTASDPHQSDSDGDGCPDGDEHAQGSDPCDPTDPSVPCGGPGATDCNNNGIPDATEIANDPTLDCNKNRVHDDCEDGACCYKPFGSPVCFEGPKSGGESIDPPASCDIANSWYPGGAVWYGPCVSCDSFQDAVSIDEGGTIFHHQVGQPIDCPDGGISRANVAGCTGVFRDPWKSDPGSGTMCENFGSGDAPVIPAGTFGPGSDAFVGQVCFAGVSLGIAEFGDADTIIERTQDPFDRCALPSPAEVAVAVQIAALHLTSTQPITVTYDGGQNPEQWNVSVGLSSVVPQPGTLTAIKTHCNGGTYTNNLNVEPLFTFTKVSDPGASIDWDPDPTGQSPVILAATTPQPWVSDIDPSIGVLGDACSQFHAGIDELLPQTDCDCNGNGQRDLCDIEQSSSLDCNRNGVPDECDVSSLSSADCNLNFVPDDCEPDCNGNNLADVCDVSSGGSSDCNSNAVPDECEPDCNGNGVADGCDISAAASADCQQNGRPDECDVASGAIADCQRNLRPDACDLLQGLSLDSNGDAVPDECGFSPPTAPQPAPGAANGNRSIAILIPASATAGPASSTALRVRLIDLQNPQPPNPPSSPPPDFSTFESGATCQDAGVCARWVGPPRTYLESQDSAPAGAFRAARLQCTPYYHDWGGEGVVNLSAAEVVPSSRYEILAYAASCEGAEGTCTGVSAVATLVTARYGDLVSPFNPPATSTQPDSLDIATAVNKFKGLPATPSKAFAQLQPNFPDLNADMNALDIAACVDAFKGFAYAFSGPCECPSSVPCAATPCNNAGQCTTSYGAGATCVKTCTSGPHLGEPCTNGMHCGACAGGDRSGYPCDADADCPDSTCTLGACGTGFCRDRCGRCN